MEFALHYFLENVVEGMPTLGAWVLVLFKSSCVLNNLKNAKALDKN